MLNWTTGPTNLSHAVRTTGLKHVITSDRFTDEVLQAMEGMEFVSLEEVRQGIGRFELLRTALTVRLRPHYTLRRLPQVSPEANALILFTSGSEKEPKAVPLTHRNLLSNQRAALEVMEFQSNDAVLGFLPAFHSFGLAVTSLLPLLAGIRLVHHPDPTAASALARKIAVYRPTITAGAPTFVSAILDRAKPGQLDSLRLIYVGA